MASAGWDLQKAIHAALAADAPLAALLGGSRIFDAPPGNAAFPYLAIDQIQIRDWSTGTEPGAEHMVMLHVWSRHSGKMEVHEISDAVRGALDGVLLSLDDHRLVNLRHQYSELKRDPDGETHHGVLRFRAVTEPLS
jgi:hypothetical protein